jgi:L-ribulose-5-phosphate 3-epimerase
LFRLGYNTNGLAHHRILDALELVAGLGYRALAITPDVGQLDPYRLDSAEVAAVRERARSLDLALAIETGARFVIDPRRKHRPNLLDAERGERARRIDFLCRSVDLASDLGASVVSVWSGVAPGGVRADDPAAASSFVWERLCEGLVPVLDRARERGVRLAFEPEPGMFVERPPGYDELVRRLGSRGRELALTLDVGHLVVTGDLPVGDAIRARRDRLIHVHLDDCRHGEHEHRMFGQGDLDLGETLAALAEIGFEGIAAVELSRDSHRGAEAAEQAIGLLRRATN